MNEKRDLLSRLSLGLAASARNLFKDSDWRTLGQLSAKLDKLTSFWQRLQEARFIPSLVWQTGGSTD